MCKRRHHGAESDSALNPIIAMASPITLMPYEQLLMLAVVTIYQATESAISG